jgi:NAD(P)-dependent dehydrogenase (short-subunit alcohol dehydrogenase family)
VTDRVAVITGGSRGIGRATAIAAAKRGYRVVVGYASNHAAASEVVAMIERSNGKAIAVKCDVAEESEILNLFEAGDKLGTLGALVNNGGIVSQSGVRVDEMSIERIQRVMAINVIGNILCAREAVKRMSTKHGGRGQARRRQHLCRLRGIEGRDRFLHHRSGARGCERRHTRRRDPSWIDRH